MSMKILTLWQLAERLVGEVKERPGAVHDPFVQWCHESCGLGPESPDETPWCSSFVNRLAWLLRMPRSKSAAARSWLGVGMPVEPSAAIACANDVVVLQRGTGPQPGPEVLRAPGHVGLFGGWDGDHVRVLGGNQSNGVTVALFPVTSVLGIRRLA